MRITGLVGLFTDPAYIVESARDGEVRQQFVVCFHGWIAAGPPCPDLHETIDAAWFDPAEVEVLPVEPGARMLIHHALCGAAEPFLT